MFIYIVKYWILSDYEIYESLQDAKDSVSTVDFGCEGIRQCEIIKHKLPCKSQYNWSTIIARWTKSSDYEDWEKDTEYDDDEYNESDDEYNEGDDKDKESDDKDKN